MGSGRRDISSQAYFEECKDIYSKLEQAWMLGASDVAASAFAGISVTKLSNLLKENRDLMERRDALKKNMVFKSLRVLNKSLDNGDVDTAKWYLERKCKEEFGKDGNGYSNEIKDEREDMITIVLDADYEEKKDGRDETDNT